MSAVTLRVMAPTRSVVGLFRRRPTSRSDVKRTTCAGRSQNRSLMRGDRT